MSSALSMRVQDDREVAGDAVRPERLGVPHIALQYLGGRAQRRLGEENAVGEPLEEVRVVGGDPEVVELHLGLGPRRCPDALERRRVAILVGERERCFVRRGDEGGERDVCRRARRETDAAAQARDRIQHRPDRIGERAAVDHRHRRTDTAAASEKPRAIGLELDGADCLTLDRDHVGREDRRFVIRTRTPYRQHAVALVQELGVHEQIGEGGMGGVGGKRREHQLGVRGELDLPRAHPEVADRYAPDLGVVLRRHDDLERGENRSVAAHDLDAVFRKPTS